MVDVFVTTPDGHLLQRTARGSVAVSAAGTTRCELPVGPRTAVGDLTTYTVTVAPYRPGGTAVIALGNDVGRAGDRAPVD